MPCEGVAESVTDWPGETVVLFAVRPTSSALVTYNVIEFVPSARPFASAETTTL